MADSDLGGSIINTVFDRFERSLRWLYPGLLFLVLLRMSRPDEFEAVNSVLENYWDLVGAGIVAGVAIYLFQAYLVGQVISAIGVWCKWDVNALLPGETPVRSSCVLTILDRQAVSVRKRWGRKIENGLGGYLDYSWAAYHALSITGWLTIVMFGLKCEGSVFEKAGCPILVLAILLMVGALWLYAQLTRIPK